MRNRDWKAIAQYQLKNFFNKDANDPKEELGGLLQLYGSDVYEQFMEDPKCAECGEIAKQRCSKCKGEWYCSRECQIKKWKQHKEMCAVLSKIRQEEDEREAEIKKLNKEKYGDNSGIKPQEQKKKPMI